MKYKTWIVHRNCLKCNPWKHMLSLIKESFVVFSCMRVNMVELELVLYSELSRCLVAGTQMVCRSQALESCRASVS